MLFDVYFHTAERQTYILTKSIYTYFSSTLPQRYK